jgi:diguanylate cyclase (GGDEF)-like protein/PAS domain S-box-containing protein
MSVSRGETAERRAHELGLRASEERFRLMVESVQDYAILMLDPTGNVATWNVGARRLKGYEAEEIIGGHFSVFYPPSEIAAGKPKRELELAAATGRLEDEGWRVRKDGSQFWANVVITAMRDRDGTLVGYGKITRDLTERRAHELELGASEERFRLMVESVQDYAIFMLDPDGKVATWNAGARRLKGYEAEEIIGRHFSVFYPPEHVAAAKPQRELETAAADGRLEDEGWRVRKDGSQFFANVVITALRDETGALRGYGKVTRDITARRLAEDQLRVAEEQFRRSFDDAPLGMMIVDLDGQYLQVNDAFCAILGHSRATLVGRSGESITHPDDVAADEQAVGRLLAGESRSFTREKRFLHCAGDAVWTSINVTLLRDADGRPDHFIAQVQDITERRLYESQLRHMADHDPLTGLLNRRSFNRELDNHVARAKRSGTTGAVLIVDLDNFKYYNDTQGHSAGDALIVRIGQSLGSRLRETDIVSRLGGDEFAVLLAREDPASAEIVARALLEVICREAPDPTLGEQRRVTASIGIACFHDGERLTGAEIMVNADLAMYDAKESGRNRVARYRTDEHERPRIENEMKWARKITQALAEDHFALLAQPIQPLRGGGSTQYELLLRMRDAHGDQIPPGTFLYIAERLGLIHEIDRWVVAHAIDLLAEHRAAGRDLRFEVNLSGHTIGDPELLELIERRLRETGVPPDRLIFEITETAAVANIARAATFAQRLSALGCHFALDDFGAGFGSFYYLKHLPFDYLKIDGEYVRHCATNETDRILISAVVQIARGMGKHTIAEFVGDQETVEVLAGLGVDYGQGYFLGRPEPLGDHLAGRDRHDGAPAGSG